MTYTIDCSQGVDLTLAPENQVQEVIQGIFILLNTPVGSVPCYREFGIDVEYLHKPMQLAKTLFAAAVTDAIEQFIPGVQLQSVSFAGNADSPSTLRPILEVTIFE
jgi:phage baseplate assembly protein W